MMFSFLFDVAIFDGSFLPLHSNLKFEKQFSSIVTYIGIVKTI